MIDVEPYSHNRQSCLSILFYPLVIIISLDLSINQPEMANPLKPTAIVSDTRAAVLLAMKPVTTRKMASTPKPNRMIMTSIVEATCLYKPTFLTWLSLIIYYLQDTTLMWVNAPNVSQLATDVWYLQTSQTYRHNWRACAQQWSSGDVSVGGSQLACHHMAPPGSWPNEAGLTICLSVYHTIACLISYCSICYMGSTIMCMCMLLPRVSSK